MKYLIVSLVMASIWLAGSRASAEVSKVEKLYQIILKQKRVIERLERIVKIRNQLKS
jgi:hypothetical protein